MSCYKALSALLTLTALSMPGLAAVDEPPPELNQAQTLVFMGDHLQQIAEGKTVVYDFTRRMTGQPEQHDEIRMTVTKVRDDALRNLSFEFLSGPDRIAFPPAEGYRGNPIPVQFLERDIRDMAQATGNSPAYFRNRIRKAFRDPQIEKTRLAIDGVELDTVEITVVPFKADKNVAQFEGYADKQYRFAYSDQIPGGLVSIQTRMAGASGAILEEALSYSRIADAL